MGSCRDGTPGVIASMQTTGRCPVARGGPLRPGAGGSASCSLSVQASSPSVRYPGTPLPSATGPIRPPISSGPSSSPRPASSSTASRWTLQLMAPPAGGSGCSAYRPRQIDWWATAIQLAGTVFFNVSTGNALRIDLSSQASPSAHLETGRLRFGVLPGGQRTGVVRGVPRVAGLVTPESGVVDHPGQSGRVRRLRDLRGRRLYRPGNRPGVERRTVQSRHLRRSPVLPRWRRPPPARTDGTGARARSRLSLAVGPLHRSDREVPSGPRTRRTSRAPLPPERWMPSTGTGRRAGVRYGFHWTVGRNTVWTRLDAPPAMSPPT